MCEQERGLRVGGLTAEFLHFVVRMSEVIAQCQISGSQEEGKTSDLTIQNPHPHMSRPHQ